MAKTGKMQTITEFLVNFGRKHAQKPVERFWRNCKRNGYTFLAELCAHTCTFTDRTIHATSGYRNTKTFLSTASGIFSTSSLLFFLTVAISEFANALLNPKPKREKPIGLAPHEIYRIIWP